MTHRIRSLVVAAAAIAALSPAALAGGVAMNVEGPAADGRTYTVHAYACTGSAGLHVNGWAEGVVAGKRQTVPLELRSTSDPSVYRFERNWPDQGRWVLRLAMTGSRQTTTVATFARDGSVRANQGVWQGDGTRECRKALGVRDGS